MEETVTYENFQFTYQGTVTSIPGTASFSETCSILGCGGTFDPNLGVISSSDVPENLALPVDTQTYAIVAFDPNNNFTTPTITLTGYSTSGYIGPKYKVLGVYYAVPGAGSSIQYSSNTTTSSTDSIKNTFSSSYQESISVSAGGSILGVVHGKTDVKYSNKYTQSQSSGSSVTLSSSTSYSLTIPGATNNYIPNNHDYDLIAVWLNPVALLTYNMDTNENVTGVAWNGYGFNELDMNDMDIEFIYVGCLNGDFSASDCANNLAPLNRSWDTDDTWPSGQGPALDSTDMAAILAYDPFSQCTPSANVYPSSYPTNNCTISPDPSRFTLTNNQTIPYDQPVVGAQPITDTYTLSYSEANTNSSSNTVSEEQSFGEDKNLGFKFLGGVSITIGTTQTYSSQSESDQSLTATNSQTTTAKITGPACNVVDDACNPEYPSTNDPGPTNFDLYEDTLFGTYLFYPSNWYY